ncbi:hypothetical protein BDP27DRAFT_1544772 [Rhodocollybia butyracea]|uniref:Uncharacterized protein n=1 Tax=Rhodocollybia butyracea TaxID=206335 RepID=A0A9P5PN72_9AGAR|nr:hypothetical protein BDP27DRAFT_1544772 [Rhodocollybia butyracea]
MSILVLVLLLFLLSNLSPTPRKPSTPDVYHTTLRDSQPKTKTRQLWPRNPTHKIGVAPPSPVLPTVEEVGQKIWFFTKTIPIIRKVQTIALGQRVVWFVYKGRDHAGHDREFWGYVALDTRSEHKEMLFNKAGKLVYPRRTRAEQAAAAALMMARVPPMTEEELVGVMIGQFLTTHGNALVSTANERAALGAMLDLRPHSNSLVTADERAAIGAMLDLRPHGNAPPHGNARI